MHLGHMPPAHPPIHPPGQLRSSRALLQPDTMEYLALKGALWCAPWSLREMSRPASYTLGEDGASGFEAGAERNRPAHAATVRWAEAAQSSQGRASRSLSESPQRCPCPAGPHLQRHDGGRQLALLHVAPGVDLLGHAAEEEEGRGPDVPPHRGAQQRGRQQARGKGRGGAEELQGGWGGRGAHRGEVVERCSCSGVVLHDAWQLPSRRTPQA